jgi:hypothetical protein
VKIVVSYEMIRLNGRLSRRNENGQNATFTGIPCAHPRQAIGFERPRESYSNSAAHCGGPISRTVYSTSALLWSRAFRKFS